MFVLRFSHLTNSVKQNAAWGFRSSQLVQKLSPFYGIHIFSIIFTTAHNRSVPRAKWFWSNPSQFFVCFKFLFLIFYSHLCLGLASRLFPSGCPHTKWLSNLLLFAFFAFSQHQATWNCKFSYFLLLLICCRD